MGIQGLLPALKSIMTPVHVRSYAGKKAAIDTYSWLHKAAFSCSKELCEGRPPDKFIEYCMHRVNLLRHFGVQPVLVFDGGVLPMKADQEAKRAKSRKEHLERAQEHERDGNRSAAYECYQRAVDITPALALRLIKVLQQEGVQYLVAPYEADAQMAYLALNGHVDVIITEDSDLIAYGCPRILFKMDKSGQGDEFKFDDLPRNKDPKFVNFTPQMVLEMCVMTGCDYLPSLSGMGVKKAHGHVQRFKTYRKVIRHLRFSGHTISAEYEELFHKALLTFRHQRVYDPVTQQLVHLTDVPADVTVDLEFVGPELPHDLAKSIAVGDVDPSTNLPFEESLTPVGPAKPKVSNGFSPHQAFVKKPAEIAQRNVLTKYFSSESKVAKKQFKPPRVVLCTEEQPKKPTEKERPVPLVPETEACLDVTKIFGTPLPDDGDDDDDEDIFFDAKEAHSNVRDSEQGERSTRTAGVLQGGFSVKERQESISDAPSFKVSAYFSRSQSVRSKSSKPRDADRPTSAPPTEPKDSEGCRRDVAKKSRIDVAEVSCEVFETNSSPLLELRPQVPLNDISHKTNRSAENGFWDNRSPISSPSLVPQGSSSSEVGKFATNVSHVNQFADIAQKSVDKFAKSIDCFRWSSKGARASGLRAPMSPISPNTSTPRIAAKGHSALGATLKPFAYKSSSFKPPGKLDITLHKGVTTAAVQPKRILPH